MYLETRGQQRKDGVGDMRYLLNVNCSHDVYMTTGCKEPHILYDYKHGMYVVELDTLEDLNDFIVSFIGYHISIKFDEKYQKMMIIIEDSIDLLYV